MLILWIRKKKTTEKTCPPENDDAAFQKHNEDMKRFRLTHPEILTAGSNNIDDIMTADGNILARVQKVKLTKNTQN